MKKALHGWKLDRQGVHLAVAPTIPHHCSKEFLLACLKLAKDYDTGLHTHVSESKVQVVAGYKLYGTLAHGLYGSRWASSGRSSPWRTASGSMATT